jgi:hypothetical protein
MVLLELNSTIKQAILFFHGKLQTESVQAIKQRKVHPMGKKQFRFEMKSNKNKKWMVKGGKISEDFIVLIDSDRRKHLLYCFEKMTVEK